jgi:LysM repeat protein
MAKKQNLTQIRSLTIALFISAALNLILVAYMFFWALTDRPPMPYFEAAQMPPAKEIRQAANPTNALIVRSYNALPYEQLVLKLQKKGLVEDGFSERDLALAVLATYYDFDVDKALSSRPTPLQRRWMSLGEGQESIQVFPGLSNEDHEAVLAFLKTEKWPFKAKGLFQFLKKESTRNDPTLAEAFLLTSEYSWIEKLFKGTSVDKDNLLALLSEGEWGSISSLVERIKKQKEPFPEMRQRFLLTELANGSKQASAILLQSDYDFALKRLKDESVDQMVKTMTVSDPLTLKYLNAIAASPRSERTKQLALKQYEALSGKKWEPLVSREIPVIKTLPVKPKSAAPIQSKPVAAKPKPAPVKDTLYIVQEGDSLWKLSKRYKIPIERIKSYNQLKSDALKPGSALRIPDQPPQSKSVVR